MHVIGGSPIIVWSCVSRDQPVALRGNEREVSSETSLYIRLLAPQAAVNLYLGLQEVIKACRRNAALDLWLVVLLARLERRRFTTTAL